MARALLLIGAKRPIKVLCCRELQKSISESVHAVLKEQIVGLGLEAFYDVEVARIKGKNGTTFSFEGIKNNTTAVKSYEGIDYCWVEEANKVSKASWDILTPTIRKETPLNWREIGLERPEFQAEIWMTLNPELDDDYTYKNYVKDPDLKPVQHPGVDGQPWVSMESKDSIVVKMTYRDNPWFPSVLMQDLERQKRLDYDSYLNVWEGHTIQRLEGAVFKHQLRAAREEGRICRVPYEPEVSVDCFWDLGKRDYTAIWFGQFVGMQFRMLEFFEGQGVSDLNVYIKELKNKPYIYGTHYLPHDAAHSRLGYKHSIEQQIGVHFNKKIVPKIKAIADGINMARMFFPKVWFDEKGCADGLAHLNRYAYKVVEGQYSNEPFHDAKGHVDAADAFRCAAQAFGMPKKRGLLESIGLPESMRRKTGISEANQAGARSRAGSGLGWMS